MSALTLGLVAAICWGFHDVCIRLISQTTPLMASLLTVLVVGTLFHLGIMVTSDGFQPMTGKALALSALAGLSFLIASLGLYGAFQRGPVRLVAPIIASYPILSVGWAAAQGVSIGAGQWLAVLGIIFGVSTVAALSDDGSEAEAGKLRTIAYALVAAVGFAGTFALGQWAAVLSGHLSATLVTRVVAIGLLLVLITVRRLPAWPGRGPLGVLALMGIADGVALYCVLAAGNLPNAQYAAVASSVFGLITIVMAWMFLRERMSSAQWSGCLLAFLGIGYLAF